MCTITVNKKKLKMSYLNYLAEKLLNDVDINNPDKSKIEKAKKLVRCLLNAAKSLGKFQKLSMNGIKGIYCFKPNKNSLKVVKIIYDEKYRENCSKLIIVDSSYFSSINDRIAVQYLGKSVFE